MSWKLALIHFFLVLCVSGLSDIKGICTYWRASINQDRGQYALTQTVAHELGHRSEGHLESPNLGKNGQSKNH